MAAFYLNGPSHSILQPVDSFLTHKDQTFKVDVLTGNSISNPKFRFVYWFSGENGTSLALHHIPTVQCRVKLEEFLHIIIWYFNHKYMYNMHNRTMRL